MWGEVMKIKKIAVLPVVLAFVLAVSVTVGAVFGVNLLRNSAPAQPPLRIGDLDLNGECNIIDLVMLKKFYVGYRELDALQEKQADYNEDIFIDSLDLAALRAALIGNISYGDNAVSLDLIDGGATYYVSADGTSQSGTNINDPMSLETANSKLYSRKDTIAFKSGDVFYGTADLKIDPDDTETDKTLKITSYGVGDMPTFSGVAVVTDEGAFATVTQNYMYSLDLANTSLFLAGYISGDGLRNIGFITDGTNIYGDRKTARTDLSKQYDFCIEGNTLYILCSSNPVKSLGKVMLSTDNSLFRLNSNMTVSGLRFTMCGGNAVIGGEETAVSNVTVKNCVIENIGGSMLYSNDTEFVRYGNGIEFYNKTVSDVTVTNNIIRHCYDVGFTIQGNSADCSADNIVVNENVFYKNKQSSEIFIESADSAGITGYSFTDNICIGSGSTWGNFTSNPKNGVPCEFLFYNYYPSKLDMTASGNLIMDCTRLYWWSQNDTSLFTNGVKTSNNRLYIKSSAFSFKDVTTLEGLQTTYQKEIGSEYVAITDLSAYSALTSAAASAYDYSVVAQAATGL